MISCICIKLVNNMGEEDYCIFGEGYCRWCRHCPVRYEGDEKR